MSGLTATTPTPVEIRLHQRSRLLELSFDDGQRFELSYEFLRVFTPSAEARGHAPGQETLQVGKCDVDILRVEPVGNYAIRPLFSDGHDSGLYSWTSCTVWECIVMNSGRLIWNNWNRPVPAAIRLSVRLSHPNRRQNAA